MMTLEPLLYNYVSVFGMHKEKSPSMRLLTEILLHLRWVTVFLSLLFFLP